MIDFATRQGNRRTMTHKLFGATLALLLGLAGQALAPDSVYAQDSDGDGYDDAYDDDNENGVPDSQEGSGPATGNMEAECAATARPDICLTYFQFNCQYYGFPMACAMANLGSSCNGGDQGQCQYFVGILQANTACTFGDQTACAWLSQQPILRQ
jgi:hypothetical protein